MVVIDLILIRIILAGLVIGLMLGLFLLIRRLLPQFLNVRLRRMVWLTLLVLSLLVVPFPEVVSIPDSAPAWLFQLRLPDPERVLINAEFVADFFADDPEIRSMSSGDGNIHNLLSLIGKQAEELGALPELSLADRLISDLPWIRAIYLMGFILSLIVSLTADQLHKRKIRSTWAEHPGPINQDAWHAELAAIRDQHGIYRQAIFIPANPETGLRQHLLGIKEGLISVPASSPDDIPADQRTALLLTQLKRKNWLVLLVALTWTVFRSLFWFIPLWLLADRAIRGDFQVKNGKGRQRRTLTAIISSGLVVSIVSLLLICALGILLWQMPRQILPIRTTVEKLTDQSVEFIIQDDFANAITEYHSYYNQSYLLDAAHLAMPGDFMSRELMVLSKPNEVQWRLNLLDLPEFSSANVVIMDTQRTLDGQWALLCSYNKNYQATQSYIQMMIDQNGQIVSRQALPDVIGDDPEIAYSQDHHLMVDGGWITILYEPYANSVDIISGPLQYSTTGSIASITRFSAAGERSWELGQDCKWLADIGSIVSGYSEILGNKSISQIIPTDDQGFYVVLQQYLSLQQRGSDQHIYFACDQVIRISADGSVVWQRKIRGNHDQPTFLKGVVDQENNLYLTGLSGQLTGFTRTANYHPALVAIGQDGQILWQKTIDSLDESSATDLIEQNGVLTICSIKGMLSGNTGEMSLLQFDLKGDPQAAITLQNTNQGALSFFVDGRQIFANRRDVVVVR